MNNRGNRLIIIIITIMLLNPTFIVLIEYAKGDLADPSSLTPHAPILIQSNADFLSVNGVVAGNGSISNPFIIENWTIDASISDGVKIINTTKNFIIRNCHISNSYGTNHRSIYFLNVTNGEIHYSRINDNYYGIDIESSEQLEISNVDVFIGYGGISLYKSNNITMENITVNRSMMVSGISLGSSEDIVLKNITSFDNENGIVVWGSKRITILNGDFYNNTDIGISSMISTEIIIRNTSIYNNEQVGIEIEEASQMSIQDNSIYDNEWGLIISYFVNNCSVSNNRIYDNGGGVILRGGKDCQFLNNIIENNSRYGISIYSSRYDPLEPFNNVFYSNVIYGSPKNFIFGPYSSLKWNTIPENNTVDGKPIYIWVGKEGETVPADAGYVGLVECNNIKVHNLILSNNGQGIVLVSSNNTIIENNVIANVTTAIDGYYSNPIIQNNEIQNISLGISIFEFDSTVIIEENNIHHIVSGLYQNDGIRINSSTNATLIIENNNIFNSSFGWYYNGISIEKVNNAIICNNSLEDMHVGLRLDNLTGTIVSNNTVHNNYFGISYTNISTEKHSIIYNNYFNNSNNYRGTNGSYEWNITKSIGRNIVKGIYLGGNYWSDYTGQDNNGDYIGDTELPYGPGDYNPLIISPAVIDLTKDIPKTNGSFEFNVSVYFETGIGNVTLKYWTDDLSHSIEIMSLTSGNYHDGFFSKSIKIPVDSKSISYYITAESLTGQKVTTPTKELAVIDVILPNISDYIKSPKTGDELKLEFNVKDNIGIRTYNITYWFDNESKTHLIRPVNMVIKVPLQARYFNYIINSVDLSSNSNSFEKTMDVIDNKPPIIVTSLINPWAGEEFSFKCNVTDNWDVEEVNVEYWFDENKTLKIMFQNGTNYQVKIDIPTNATILYYSIIGLDNSNNSQIYNGSIVVLDKIYPTIVDLTKGKAEAGSRFRIKVSAKDNIQIKDVSVEYWYNDEKMNGKLVRVNDTYIYNLSVPKNVNKIYYVISAEDNSGNIQEMPVKTINVNQPVFYHFYIIITILLICIIVSGVIIYYKWFKRGKKKGKTNRKKKR